MKPKSKVIPSIREFRPTPVAVWLCHGLLKDEAEARGGFEIAYQTFMDGAGSGSAAQYMGLNSAEFEAWFRRRKIPKLAGWRTARSRMALSRRGLS